MTTENQSQLIDAPFRVKSTWDVYDEKREWCMTAKFEGESSRVHIRECNENGALQMWSTDSYGQIRLLTESNLCIRVKDRTLYLDQCFERGDIENTFEIHPDTNEISHVDIDGQRYLFGLREWRKWGRVLIFEEDYDNDTMQTWNFEIDPNALTKSPTTSPTVSPSLQPSRSPTPLPSPSPSYSPSVSPSLQPSRSLTPIPSAKPSQVPSRRPTVSPSSPEVQGTRDVPTSGTDIVCELRDGKYGEETEKKHIVEYFYKMIYNEESSPNDLLKVLDKSIAEKVITDSGVFPQCSTQLSGGESTIVGISSSPMDQFNSFCGPRCAVVEGSLTLYGSSSGSRQLSTEFELEDVMSSIEDALSSGDLIEGSTELLDLSFLSPDDSLISKNSIGIPSNRTTPQASGESGFPIWAYIAAASGAIILAVIAFFAIRRRGKNNQNDVLRRDNIDINEISADAAPASIDRRDLTLQDDGSASFI